MAKTNFRHDDFHTVQPFVMMIEDIPQHSDTHSDGDVLPPMLMPMSTSREGWIGCEGKG
jgi:hypothetical protein